MNNERLDREEKELLEAYESGEFVSDLTEERRAYLEETAGESFKFWNTDCH